LGGEHDHEIATEWRADLPDLATAGGVTETQASALGHKALVVSVSRGHVQDAAIVHEIVDEDVATRRERTHLDYQLITLLECLLGVALRVAKAYRRTVFERRRFARE
jgi:hypothetical protein